MWSTVGDMYRWVIALEEKRIVPEEEWRVLTAPAPPPAEEAFGWHVETTPEGRLRYLKGGGSDDFASHLLYYPRERVVIVWATNNLRQRWRRTLNQALPALVFDNWSSPLPKVARVDAATLARLEARYVAGLGVLELRAGSGYLYAVENALEIPTNVMFFPQDASRYTAFDPATGALTRLQLHGSDLTVTLASGRHVAGKR